jgi:hypothetical protein
VDGPERIEDSGDLVRLEDLYLFGFASRRLDDSGNVADDHLGRDRMPERTVEHAVRLSDGGRRKRLAAPAATLA